MLLSLVILFVLVSVVLTLEGRARPVSVNQAISHYHSDPSAEPGTHPSPGVYLYQGTGTDSLSLPPLSRPRGQRCRGPSRSKPTGVGASALTTPPTTGRAGPTAHAHGLAETGGMVWQRWMIGPVTETNLTTLRCSLALLSIPSAPAADNVRLAHCRARRRKYTAPWSLSGPPDFSASRS